MQVGVTLPLTASDTLDGHVPTWTETREYAHAAEALGLDSIWAFDHLLFRYPNRPDEGIREAWTSLVALAPVVPRVDLGTLVLATPFRNPALLAKMAATLDDIAGGRLILGIGTGWHDPEFEAFGYPVDHKVSRFEEAIEIIVRLLRGERLDHDGRDFTLRGGRLLPLPNRLDIPVLVAAKGPRMLELTARWADAWNTAWYGSVDDRLRTAFRLLDEACERVGRDPRSIVRTVGMRAVDPDLPPRQAETDARSIRADAAGLAELLGELERFGTDQAIAWLHPKTISHLERFGRALGLHRAVASG